MSDSMPQPVGVLNVVPNVCSLPAGLAAPVASSRQHAASTPAASAGPNLSTPLSNMDGVYLLQVMQSTMHLCTSMGGVTSALRTTADVSRSLGTTSS